MGRWEEQQGYLEKTRVSWFCSNTLSTTRFYTWSWRLSPLLLRPHLPLQAHQGTFKSQDNLGGDLGVVLTQ